MSGREKKKHDNENDSCGGPRRAQTVTWGWTDSSEGGYGTLAESDGLPAVMAWDGPSGGSMTYAAKMTIGGFVTGSTIILQLSSGAAGLALRRRAA